MRFFEWFYAVPHITVSWGAPEVGAMLRGILTFPSRGTGPAQDLAREVQSLIGAGEVIPFEKGRSALKWILACAKAREASPKKVQVILPSLLCTAVPQAVTAAGLDPVLCDVTEELAMDPKSAEAMIDPERTLAVVVPHIYGMPSPVDRFKERARSKGLCVIDDAAAALGGHYRSQPLGLLGDAGLFSFSQGKSAAAGGGGLLVLPRDSLFLSSVQDRPALELPDPWQSLATFRRFVWHDLLHRFSGPMGRVYHILKARFPGKGGSKGGGTQITYRGMAPLQARVALAQVKRLEALARARRRNMEHLAEELSGLTEIRLLPLPEESVPTRFILETRDLRVERDGAGIREENPLAVHLRKQGIEARYAYLPLHRYEAYKDLTASPLDLSDRLGDRLLLLPFQPPLDQGSMARIGRAMRTFFGK